MKILLRLLIISSWLVTASHTAAVQCQGICEVDLNMDCENALVSYDFSGDCCALKEIDGTCYMVTTDNCQKKPAGASDVNCDPSGGCLPAFTVYFSDSEEPCPPTDFDIPGVTFPTFVPLSTGPSVAPLTLSDQPSAPFLVLSGANSDIVAGTVSEGDCFYVERTFYDQVFSDDCRELITELAYYNGGMNPEHGDTGFERDDILHIRSLYRDCPDDPDHCRITVDGYPDQHCDCTFEDEKFTLGECSSQALENVFTTPGQSVVHAFETDEPTLYQTEFFTIDCGDCCNHPSHGAVSECPPAMLECPDGTVVSNQNPECVMEKCPMMVSDCPPALMVCPDGTTVSNQNEDCVMEECPSQGPTAAPGSAASVELIEGNVEHGDCYTVKRHLESTEVSNGCTASFLKLTYYNGGVNGYHQDTGYPQVDYLVVEAEIKHDCDDPTTNKDHCYITVYDDDAGIHTCNECSFENSEVKMDDCSNVPGVFVHGEQSVSLFGGDDVPYQKQFFTLTYDEDKCSHPALADASRNEVSDVPSIVPFSDAPSTERYMVSSYYTEDVVPGDIDQGDCYLVSRVMWDTIYSDGCTDSHLEYKYYNGGTNEDYADTGYPKEEYFQVQLDATHSCDDNSPKTCAMKIIREDGETIDCNACSFDDGTFTMEDCTNAGSVFPPGAQSASLWFEYSSEYDTAFLKLSYDEEKCMHPALLVSLVPSIVPISISPSIVPTPSSAPSFQGVPTPSSAPSFQGTSDTPEACQVPPDAEIWAVGIPAYPGASFADVLPGDPSTGACYSIRRESGGLTQRAEENPNYYCCDIMTRKYTYYNGGVGANDVDSGLPEEIYATVEISVAMDCGDRGIPTACSLEVMNVGSCECMYEEDTEEVYLGDCGRLGVFTSMSQQVSFRPYLNEDSDFFTLAYDEERCEHSVWSSTVPSSAPPLDGTTIAEATFFVGFFDGVQIRAPALDEVDSFLEATTTFFTFYLGDELPNLESFEARLHDFSFDADVNRPVRIDFDAVATFDEGDGGRLLLSAEAMLDVMANLDFNTFIQSYIWDYGYLTLFYDTQQVAFSPRNEAGPVSLSPSSIYSDVPSGAGPSFVPWSDSPSATSPSYIPWSVAPSAGYPSSHPWSDAPSGEPPSFVPSGEPPSSIPSGDSPSYAPWPFDSDFPTFVPVASSFRCYDEFSNGIVNDDKCHATDIYHCIEEWEDGCTSLSAYFDYYNQYTTPGASSRESYYYIQVHSASGCDPDLNPGQPENGCTVDVFGDTCLECFSDGDKITLVDCTNVPDVFDPPQGQIISLDSGGDAFDVIETEEMCNHPAVVYRSDSAAQVRGEGQGERTETLPISVTLHYFFFNGEGKNPDSTAVSLLVAQTLAFFQMVFLEDAVFTDILKDIEMVDIESSYSEAAPDEFTLALLANIDVDKTDDGTTPSSQDASELLGASNLSDYLRHHVRTNAAKDHNIFFEVQKVRFEGVTKAHKTS